MLIYAKISKFGVKWPIPHKDWQTVYKNKCIFMFLISKQAYLLVLGKCHSCIISLYNDFNWCLYGSNLPEKLGNFC